MADPSVLDVVPFNLTGAMPLPVSPRTRKPALRKQF